MAYFLRYCLDYHVIPKGFDLKFHLALNVDNHELQATCTRTLQKASRELCEIVLKGFQDKVKNLQQELQLSREKLFEELGHPCANKTWNYLRQQNFLLHRNLKILEKRKFEKTIAFSNSDFPVHTANQPSNLHAGGRRYHKIRRLRRKRYRFRRRRKELRAALDTIAQHLNPINLSDAN